MATRVVIIGAGQAGFAAAATLRQEKFEGGITVLGAEKVTPCQRRRSARHTCSGRLRPSACRFAMTTFTSGTG
ncbi:FAD-dependent oxidoreductase [Rhizobium phaseoli]|uniref:FAD-dependent oxidoreductase n=1 Tax=Rhizobium phaseoli TaxID=396 RepID=UPI000202CFBF|nr:hypothetical protein AMC87_PD00804 [Rhizobium phaseoli]EGE55734.1 hypothetical protein RHECNPAF_880024 [Rhizobium etli CNPAF512]